MIPETVEKVVTESITMSVVLKGSTLEEQKAEDEKCLLRCEGIGVSADHAEALRGAKGCDT